MKIRLWYHISDGGDGSASVSFYATQKEAQAAADEEMESFGQCFDENVDWAIIDTDDFIRID